MRESRTSGSAGAGGGQPPSATRPVPCASTGRTDLPQGIDNAPLDVVGRAVDGLHRIAPSRHFHHRGTAEVFRERLHVDRRTGHDHLEIVASFQEPAQVAQQEVDVEAALVRLVDDDALVAPELAIPLYVVQEKAVRHHLDDGGGRRAFAEPHRVADFGTHLDAHFGGDPCRYGSRRQASRLGVGDHPPPSPSGRQTGLRELRGLAGSGLAGHDQHPVLAHQLDDIAHPGRDRQFVGKFELHRTLVEGPPVVGGPAP